MTVHKTVSLTVDEDGWMIASTPTRDRDNDRVFPMGAVTDGFQKNPALFFGHSYHEPWSLIGRVADLNISVQDIRFRPELREPANDSDPMHIVRALYDQKLLRASSIGFIPLEWRENEFGGRDFTKWELLEISLVGLPANREAVALAAKALAEPIESNEPSEPVTKRGRVLSSKNERRIRDAVDMLSGVLSELGEEEPDKAHADAVTKSQLTPTETHINDPAASTDDNNELTPEQEAELATMLLGVGEALKSKFLGE